MMADSVSVKRHMLHVIKTIKNESEYLGKTIDAIFQFPVPHQEALVAYFMEEIGQDGWEPFAKDTMEHPEFFKILLVFFSGREKFKKEPDKYQLIQLLVGYLESKHCHEIVDVKAKKEIADMIGELG